MFDFLKDAVEIYFFGMIIFLMGLRFVVETFSFKMKGTRLSGKVVKVVPIGAKAAAPIVEYTFNGNTLRSPGINILTLSKVHDNVNIYYNPEKNPDCVLISSPMSDITGIIMCAIGLLMLGLCGLDFYDYSSEEIKKGIYADKIVEALPCLIILLVLVLIFAIVIFKISFAPKSIGTVNVKKEKNLARGALDMLFELSTHGYSAELVDKLTGFIEELKKDDSYYSEYKDNVLILVGVYVFRHEYENAIHWIDSLDEDRLLKEAPKDREPWLSLVNYYSLKMEICRWTDDHEQAETLLEKGKKKFKPFAGKSDRLDSAIETFYYDYYFLNGKYEQARIHAEKILELKKNDRIHGYRADLRMAEICHELGDIEGFNRSVEIAKEKLKDRKDGQSRFIFEDYMKRIGLS